MPAAILASAGGRVVGLDSLTEPRRPQEASDGNPNPNPNVLPPNMEYETQQSSSPAISPLRLPRPSLSPRRSEIYIRF